MPSVDPRLAVLSSWSGKEATPGAGLLGGLGAGLAAVGKYQGELALQQQRQQAEFQSNMALKLLQQRHDQEIAQLKSQLNVQETAAKNALPPTAYQQGQLAQGQQRNQTYAQSVDNTQKYQQSRLGQEVERNKVYAKNVESQADYRTGKLEQGRQQAAQDTGRIHWVPGKGFFNDKDKTMTFHPDPGGVVDLKAQEAVYQKGLAEYNRHMTDTALKVRKQVSDEAALDTSGQKVDIDAETNKRMQALQQQDPGPRRSAEASGWLQQTSDAIRQIQQANIPDAKKADIISRLKQNLTKNTGIDFDSATKPPPAGRPQPAAPAADQSSTAMPPTYNPQDIAGQGVAMAPPDQGSQPTLMEQPGQTWQGGLLGGGYNA